MRIVITTHYFFPHVGGVEVVARNQAKRLVEQGHEVTLVTSKLGGDLGISEVDGVRVIRVPALNYLEKKLGVPFPVFSPKLLSVLRAEVARADLVHVHGHVYLPSVVAVHYARRFGKPVLVTQHNTYIQYNNPVLRLMQSVADRTLGAYTLGSSEAILAVSDETRKYVSSMLGSSPKTRVAYNGTDAMRYRPPSDKRALRERLGLSAGFLCLTVRRITFKNGIDTLLRAAELLKDDDHVQFVVGGKGPDLGRAREFVMDCGLKNVHLLGFVPDESLPEYFSAADVFVLPSRAGEGLPLVVLDAFAAGIPVIATRSGGHVEIVKDGESGYLVDVDDPRGIAEKVALLARNPGAVRSMATQCRVLAETKFSWEANVASLSGVYRDLVDRRSPDDGMRLSPAPC